MAVTNKRVIIKTGLISRRTVELNLAKIENIAVDQGMWGRMMGFGKETVVGTGGTREAFTFLSALWPPVVRRGASSPRSWPAPVARSGAFIAAHTLEIVIRIVATMFFWHSHLRFL